MLLAELVEASNAVAATRSRNQKRDLLAALLAKLGPDEMGTAVSYLSGRLPQGRVGVGPAALRRATQISAAAAPTLSVAAVAESIDRVAAIAGKGSGAERARSLSALFGAAREDEQRFLALLLMGELRQGALDGVMVEALAKATATSAAEVRRAFMVSGDLVRVAEAARFEGTAGLARLRLAIGTPVQSMLAQSAGSVEDAVTALGSVILDHKMDGARVQVHKLGAEVAVFSRRLHDVTASVPEIVDAVREIPLESAVLDGEAIALDSSGRPHPFQTTMRRFGRKLDVAAVRRALPLSVFFFDCLHAGGEDLLEQPLRARLAALDGAISKRVMPRLEPDNAAAADAFLDAAIAAGHEGVMAKDPASPYASGKRGSAWLKIKPAHTLDLVVLGAEWGHGRRKGWLSNLHLGARDEGTGQYVMLGKTFKGLTDAMLEWQTKTLLALEVAREGHVVFVEPRVVAEVAFNEVQTSAQYPGGLALRFARVKAYRPDKAPEDADTLDAVRVIHARTHRG